VFGYNHVVWNMRPAGFIPSSAQGRMMFYPARVGGPGGVRRQGADGAARRARTRPPAGRGRGRPRGADAAAGGDARARRVASPSAPPEHTTTFPSSQVRKTQVGEDFRK
jgi:hypothetical protein